MDAHAGLLDLGDAGAAERARVGGKAGVLGELAAAGLPVPPGFVVTAADLDADGWEAGARRQPRVNSAGPGSRSGPLAQPRICPTRPTRACTRPI